MTTETRMPYGGVIHWRLPNGKSVHDPSVHHGYRHLVAWRVHQGSYAYYIEMMCQAAKDAGAPVDAIYLSGSDHSPEPREWRTYAQLTDINPQAGHAIRSYVDAMFRMEKERAGR